MKETIKQVEDYFKGKLLRGEFEIIERGDCTYKVLIDGEYTFNIWVANSKDHRDVYRTALDNYMNFKLTTLKEKHKLNTHLWRDYKDYMNNTHKDIIKKKIAELEAEL